MSTKNGTVVALLVFLSLRNTTKCSTFATTLSPRQKIVAPFFIRDRYSNAHEICTVTALIDDYSADPSLEFQSKSYRAHVVNPHCWSGSVVLTTHSGQEVRRFYANYIRSVTISPQEDIVVVVCEKSKGNFYGINYPYVTRNFFWRSLALTGFAVEDGTSYTFWPSTYTQKRIGELAKIDPPLEHKPLYCDRVSRWPIIYHARIKKSYIHQDEMYTLKLHDEVPIPPWYDEHNRPHDPRQTTRTLWVRPENFLRKMRHKLKEAQRESALQAAAARQLISWIANA